MEEKVYTFSVDAVVRYVGVVTAASVEEAEQKCLKGEYDDILDSCEDCINWDTLQIDE